MKPMLVVLMGVGVFYGCAHGVREAESTSAPTVQNSAASATVVTEDTQTAVVTVFTVEDRRHIHDYYYREQRDSQRKEKRKSSPPGLAKRDELPPGLQKQIQRNGQLPRGLKGRNLPSELEQRLSPLPPNYIRLQLGRDIVLLDLRTRIVVDVIKNIFP